MLSQDEQWLLTEKYGGEESAGFFADCKRLKAGEPLGYIIGHTPFLGCTIHLDSHPLIPRPETEFWVERAITVIKKNPPRQGLGNSLGLASGTVNVLDLCAGSGCIGVGVAKAIPEATVHFAELDARHLPTIGKNLEENDINCSRYKVFQSDLFSNIPGQSFETQKTVARDEVRGTGEFSKKPYQVYGEEKIGTRNKVIRPSDNFLYDFILSNPPYINPEANTVEMGVVKHEPHHALFGGKLGLELIEHIIATAPQFLNAKGQLWLEHEPEQAAAIQTMAAKNGFSPTTHTDQYGVARYSVLVLQ